MGEVEILASGVPTTPSSVGRLIRDYGISKGTSQSRVSPFSRFRKVRDISGKSGKIERSSSNRLVVIKGKNLDVEFAADRILRIEVEETSRGMSKALIVINNAERKLTDHELLQPGLQVEILTGYKSISLVK